MSRTGDFNDVPEVIITDLHLRRSPVGALGYGILRAITEGATARGDSHCTVTLYRDTQESGTFMRRLTDAEIDAIDAILAGAESRILAELRRDLRREHPARSVREARMKEDYGDRW